MGKRRNYAEKSKKIIQGFIAKRCFKIGKQTFVPLHSTHFGRIMKDLEKEGCLIRQGNLKRVLDNHRLEYQDYARLRGGTELLHPSVTCFEIRKEIF